MQYIEKILLLEDVDDTRKNISNLLHKAFGDNITIIETDTLQKARQYLQKICFNLAIVDIYLPENLGSTDSSQPRGIAFLKEIKKINQETFCVIMTAFNDDANIFSALKAGADGYLLKGQDEEKLIKMLQGIIKDDPPISPSIARHILKHFWENNDKDCFNESSQELTKKEKDVLTYLSQGFTRKEIASLVGCKNGTIAGNIREVYQKLNISSCAEAVWEAQRIGIASGPASFKITKKCIEKLRLEDIPNDIIEKLKEIQDREIKGKKNFIEELKITIGNKQSIKYISKIMKNAIQTIK